MRFTPLVRRLRFPRILIRILMVVFLFSLLFGPMVLPSVFAAVCNVTGRAYYDYDFDTDQNSNPAYTEDGLYGITVTVYYTDLGGLLASLTATTDVNGDFSINIPDLSNTGQEVRIEYTDLAYFVNSGRFGTTGTGSGTTTNFVDCGGGGAVSNLAVGTTEPNCQYRDNPHMVTTCFSQGDQTAGDPVFIALRYDSGLDATLFPNTNDDGAGTTIRTLVDEIDLQLDNQVGSILGIAHSKTRNIVYNAAFMKLFVNYGAISGFNPGAIYLTDLRAGAINASVLTTLPAAAPAETNLDWHPDVAAGFGEVAAWDYVGKRSLGDIDISTDDNTIYAWNYWDKQFYAIGLTAAGTGVVGTTTYPMPDPAAFGATRDCQLHPTGGAVSANDYATDAINFPDGGTFFNNPTDPNIDLRPGAVKVFGDRVFVGITCTAESMSTDVPGAAATAPYGLVGYEDELAAYVFEYLVDPNNSQALTGPTLVAEIPLHSTVGGFDRGCIRRFPGGCTSANWRPWQPRHDNLFESFTSDQYMWPQPWLSDIEFDEQGFMIVTFTDRIGHTTIATPGEITTAGDAYLLSPPLTPPAEGVASAAFGYTLENNGDLTHAVAGNRSNSGNPPGIGSPGNQRGPGGEAFYWQDYYAIANNSPGQLLRDFHQQLIQGSAAVLQGTGDVVLASMDPGHCDERLGAPIGDCGPAGITTGVNAGGLVYLNNSNGSRSQSIEIFDAGTTNGFNKANGIGDIEFICSPPPLEIGNRVWYDANQDGVQDPNEAGIPGVTVSLYMDTNGDGIADTLVGQLLTDAEGRYIFNENIVTGNPSAFTMNFTTPATDTDTFFDINNDNNRNDGTPGGPGFASFDAFEPQGILANTVYEVRLDNPADFQPGGTVYTAVGNTQPFDSPDFNDATANGTIRDDNGVLTGAGLLGVPGVTLVATVDTGNWGDNNHTYDFGMFGLPITPTPTSTPTSPGGAATPPGGGTSTIGNPGLGLSKIGFLTPAQGGQTSAQIQWVIVVTNNGGATGSNVVIVDDVSPDLQIDNVTTTSGSVSVNGQTVTVTIPSLPVGNSVTVTITTTTLSGAGLSPNLVYILGSNISTTGLVVSSLPETGESPLPRALFVAGLFLVLGAGILLKRWSTSPMLG